MKKGLRLIVLSAVLAAGAMACAPRYYHGHYVRYRPAPRPGHTYYQRLPSGQLLQCRVYQGSYRYRTRYGHVYRLSPDLYARCYEVRGRRYGPY